jgi:fatty-acyl-CoA synthase
MVVACHIYPQLAQRPSAQSQQQFMVPHMVKIILSLALTFVGIQAAAAADQCQKTACVNVYTDNNEIIFAAPRIGAIHLPLNWRLAVPELEFILNDAEPRVLFYSEEFSEQAAELKRRCNIPVTLLKRDGTDSDYERAIAADIALGKRHRPSHDDVWVLMYTSGTTGRPKGAQITYGAQFFNAVNATMKTDLTSRSKGLTYLPQFHVGGICLYAMPCFHLGAPLVIMRQFDPQHALDLLGNPSTGITHVFGVPTNFLFMSQLPGFEAARFDHLPANTVH